MRVARVTARLQILWNGRRLLFQAAVTGLSLSVLVALSLPKRFESLMRLMPSQQVNSAAMLKSRTVQDDLINKFDLKKIYRDSQWEDTRRDLTRNTTISEDLKSGIVTVRVRDKNPLRAAAMAQEYAEELNRLAIQLNRTSAHATRVYLEQQLALNNQDLEAAEAGFSAFSGASMVIDMPEQINSAIKAANGIHQQLIAEQADLQSLKRVYVDGNSQVRSRQARVEELKRQWEKSIGVDSPGAASETEEQRFHPSMRQLPLLGVDYADLNRTVENKERIAQELDIDRRSEQFEEASEIPLVTVLDPPNVPEKKSQPAYSRIILSGTCLSVLLGAAWLLGASHWKGLEGNDPGKALRF